MTEMPSGATSIRSISKPQDARLLSSPQPLRAGREALKLGRVIVAESFECRRAGHSRSRDAPAGEGSVDAGPDNLTETRGAA
jgi:hypothetical protein